MIYNIYHYSLLVCAVFYLTVGMSFLLFRVPSRSIYANLNRSRLILGVVNLLFFSNYLLNFILHLRANHPYIAGFSGLNVYFANAILYGFAFTPLVNRGYLTKVRVKSRIISIGLFIAFSATSILFLKEEWQFVSLTVGSIGLAVMASTMIIQLFIAYSHAIKQADNYYSDEIEVYVRWLRDATIGISVVGGLTFLLSYGNYSLITVFNVVGIMVNFYIFISFANYTNFIEESSFLFPEPSDNLEVEDVQPINKRKRRKKVELTTLESQIDNQLIAFFSNKPYLVKGYTIEDLADDLKIDPNYISGYIKTNYRKNFREWIGELRIEEAKRVMEEDNAIAISAISDRTGFANISHFSRTFTQIVGITSTSWREKTKQKE